MLCITATALLTSTSPAVTPQGRACPPRPWCLGWLGHGAGQGQPHAVTTAVPTSSPVLGHVEGSRAGKLSWEPWGDTGMWVGRTARWFGSCSHHLGEAFGRLPQGRSPAALLGVSLASETSQVKTNPYQHPTQQHFLPRWGKFGHRKAGDDTKMKAVINRCQIQAAASMARDKSHGGMQALMDGLGQ